MRLMLLSLLAALTAAENQTAGIPFQVRASAPGTPVDNRMMTASNLTFFLNGQTASTCPLSSGCPPGNRTVLNGDASSLVRLLLQIPAQEADDNPSSILTTLTPTERRRPRRPANLRHRRWFRPLHPGSLALYPSRRVYGSLLPGRRGLAFQRHGGA